MKKGVPAYLRRIVDLLEWVSSFRPDAEVRWRGERIGQWRKLSARWQMEGGAIRLRFSNSGRTSIFRIASAQSASDRVEICLSRSRQKPAEKLEIFMGDARAEERFERRPFPNAVADWARRSFPGSVVDDIKRRPDLAHTISGLFFRMRIRCCGRPILILAAPEDLPAEEYSSALTQALLWISLLQKTRGFREACRICILLPAGQSDTLCHRAAFLDSAAARVEVCQYEALSNGELTVGPAPLPGLPVENTDFRWPVLGPFRWSPLLGRVLDMAPEAIRRYPRFQDYDSLRLWGLEFARVEGTQRDRLEFGVCGSRTELRDDNFDALENLVREILYYRRADSPSPSHPYYRLQAERWLESLILDTVDRLFPELVPQSVYSQIPVYLGRDPGRVDILGADGNGRLVVIELKVAQDPGLPLQALDYWGRVIHHTQQGDFERRGYFAGISISRAQPRIYLVSPVFSFHDTTERVITFMNPDIDVWKIGINEDWRSGVKILRRVRLRCG